MPADTAKVVVAAMRLRSVSPEIWADFVQVIREYSANMALELVKCPADSLPRVQGMAQMAQELSLILMDAPNLYEKMQRARKP